MDLMTRTDEELVQQYQEALLTLADHLEDYCGTQGPRGGLKTHINWLRLRGERKYRDMDTRDLRDLMHEVDSVVSKRIYYLADIPPMLRVDDDELMVDTEIDRLTRIIPDSGYRALFDAFDRDRVKQQVEKISKSQDKHKLFLTYLEHTLPYLENSKYLYDSDVRRMAPGLYIAIREVRDAAFEKILKHNLTLIDCYTRSRRLGTVTQEPARMYLDYLIRFEPVLSEAIRTLNPDAHVYITDSHPGYHFHEYGSWLGPVLDNMRTLLVELEYQRMLSVL